MEIKKKYYIEFRTHYIYQIPVQIDQVNKVRCDNEKPLSIRYRQHDRNASETL